MINVVNKRTHAPTKDDIAIHRGTPVGNPYTHLKSKTIAKFVVPTREDAIEAYKDWFETQIKEGNYTIINWIKTVAEKARTGSVNLVCFCDPLPCHGIFLRDFIVDYLEGRIKF